MTLTIVDKSDIKEEESPAVGTISLENNVTSFEVDATPTGVYRRTQAQCSRAVAYRCTANPKKGYYFLYWDITGSFTRPSHYEYRYQDGAVVEIKYQDTYQETKTWKNITAHPAGFTQEEADDLGRYEGLVVEDIWAPLPYWQASTNYRMALVDLTRNIHADQTGNPHWESDFRETLSCQSITAYFRKTRVTLRFMYNVPQVVDPFVLDTVSNLEWGDVITVTSDIPHHDKYRQWSWAFLRRWQSTDGSIKCYTGQTFTVPRPDVAGSDYVVIDLYAVFKKCKNVPVRYSNKLARTNGSGWLLVRDGDPNT